MNEMAQQSREKWIDNAKGISMLCVILGHVSGGLKGSWNFQFVYGFHLVMFFLLSGYTLKRKPLTVDYVNAKFSRLMIPYFYTCIAVMIMDTWNSYYLNHDNSIATVSGLIGKNLIRGFFASGASTVYGTINVGTRIGAIWFLPAMFFAVVLFQGLLQIMDESLKLGIVTFFLAMSGYLSARVIWFPFSIQAGMVATFFLWIGYEIRKKGYLDKIRWQYYLIAQIIFLLGLHYNYANAGFVVGDFNDIVFSVLVGLAGCVLVYLVSIHMEKSRIICWVGRNSILVLCTHLFALETMGAYIAWCANRIGFQGDIYVWSVIILEILVALITAFFIKMILIYGKDVSFQLHSCVGAMKKDEGLNCLTASKKMGGKAGRDTAIDATKGILIILMLIGHFPLDGRLRMIIYSFHMTAFVFLSGYFYKKGQSTVKMLVHVFRIFLIPYVIFVGGVIIKNINNWSILYLTGAVKQYLLGISFFARISWGGVFSVGPVYFILMLFAVRAIYILVDAFVQEKVYKFLLVIMLSFIGIKLGQAGYWLPWSLDVALYVLIFYQLGIYFRKYKLLTMVKRCPMCYFLLSPIWAYMIYRGSMEIAVRNYGNYGLVVIGSVSGTLLLYKYADYIVKAFPITSTVLAFIGRITVIVLIIHTLAGGLIGNLVSRRFDSNYMPYMVLSITTQIMLSVIIKFLSDFVRLRIKGFRWPYDMRGMV